MEFWLITSLGLLFAFGNGFQDPIHRMWRGRDQGRNLNCEWLTHVEAHQRHPYEITEPEPRFAAKQNREALVCTPRTLVRDGLRNPRDERILSGLRSSVEVAVSQAMAAKPNTATWYLQVHHPDLNMANKVSAALQTRLAQNHPSVRAQTPLPAAGDIEVLAGRYLVDALPLYCQRKWREGSIKTGESILVFALLHPQETEMHAATCAEGEWQWLH